MGFVQTPPAAPRIFDRAVLGPRRRRALGAREDVLLARAAEDLVERLGTVRRGFRHALDFGTLRRDAAEALRAALPGADVVRAAPIGAAPGDLVADEEHLPFRPGSFDLAVSLLSLHAVNDLPGTLVQLRRALKPDGLFLGCLFGGQTLTELRQAFSAAEAELTGGASPRVAPFSDLRDLGSLLQRAGFALPVTDVDTVVLRYASPFGLFADLRAMAATNALSLRARRPLRRALLMRAAEVYGRRFADPDGRVRATFEIVWLSGWAPHESQQQPLRPGSAKARLADALKPREQGRADDKG